MKPISAKDMHIQTLFGETMAELERAIDSWKYTHGNYSTVQSIQIIVDSDPSRFHYVAVVIYANN